MQSVQLIIRETVKWLNENCADQDIGVTKRESVTGRMEIVKLIASIILALALLYLLAIKPRLSRRRAWDAFPDVYYAHRGLHDNETDAPENSMAAFRKAVDAGFGIELDVQLSKDGFPVVFHDFILERVTGQPGKVCDYTYEELQRFPLFQSTERIPLLADVLRLVDGKVPLIVEIKVEWTDLSVCPAADALLQQYKGLYCVESFHPIVLFWYRRNRGNVLRGQLAEEFLKTGEFKGPLYFALQNLLLNWLTMPDFIAYNHKHADNLSRSLCHHFYHHMAAGWTIKSQEELETAQEEFELIIFDSFIPR